MLGRSGRHGVLSRSCIINLFTAHSFSCHSPLLYPLSFPTYRWFLYRRQSLWDDALKDGDIFVASTSTATVCEQAFISLAANKTFIDSSMIVSPTRTITKLLRVWIFMFIVSIEVLDDMDDRSLSVTVVYDFYLLLVRQQLRLRSATWLYLFLDIEIWLLLGYIFFYWDLTDYLIIYVAYLG
jgi:hypothetical protein